MGLRARAARTTPTLCEHSAAGRLALRAGGAMRHGAGARPARCCSAPASRRREAAGRCSARSAVPAAQRRNRPGSGTSCSVRERMREAADRHAIRRGARLRLSMAKTGGDSKVENGQKPGPHRQSEMAFSTSHSPRRDFTEEGVKSARARRSAAPGTRPARPARRARWRAQRPPSPTAWTAARRAPSTMAHAGPIRPRTRTARRV